MKSINNFVNNLNNPDLGRLLLRLALAMVFINMGWSKLSNMEGTIGFFASLGFSAFWAYLVAYVEFIGGIAYLLGVFVRYAGILTSIVMITAIYKVHWANGYSLANGGYEYVTVLLLASLAVVTLGAGAYSISRIFKR